MNEDEMIEEILSRKRRNGGSKPTINVEVDSAHDTSTEEPKKPNGNGTDPGPNLGPEPPPAEPPPRDPIDALVARFNQKYFVVNDNGRPCIYAPQHDPVLNRRVYHRMSPAGLRLLYENELVQVGTIQKGENKGKPKYATAANIWLGHKNRKQFINGVIFDPANRNPDPQTFNFWTGFAVEPKQGSWDNLQDHLRTNVCQGNEAHYKYLLDWMADAVQHPAKQGEVAIVMRGIEGCGKGTLARAMLRVFGQHGFAVSNTAHLTGRFNAHLRDCVILFADEAFAGDKQDVGVLKSIVTEATLTIEPKFGAVEQTANYLHIILASNEGWVIPASLHSRRWFVLDVSDARAGDRAYWKALYHELEHGGGAAAMLHDLLRRDLKDVDLRAVPVTDALKEQRKRSADAATAWWVECLGRGWVFDSELGLEGHWQRWHDFVPTEVLFASYKQYCHEHHERRPLSRELFGGWMREIGANPGRMRTQPVGEHLTDETVPAPSGSYTRRVARLIMHDHPHGYTVGTLDDARDAFEKWSHLDVEWDGGATP